VVYQGPRTKPVPKAARSYSPLDLTWSGVADRHLLIGRGERQLWRSRGLYPGTHFDVESIVFGRNKLAFALYRGRRARLFLASYGGAEHGLRGDEMPLAFTRTGDLVTWRPRGKTLLLRGGDGRFVRTVAHAVEPQTARGGTTVVFRTSKRVVAFDGTRVQTLASRSRLGLGRDTTVEALRHLVAVHGSRRLVILDYRGRLVSSASLPRSPGQVDGLSSAVVGNRAETVAFTTTSRNRAREQVYVLRAGQRRVRRVFDVKLGLQHGCGRWVSVAWHGSRLLYSNTEQQAAIVDASGRRPSLDLSHVIGGLPGFQRDGDGIFDIAWG